MNNFLQKIIDAIYPEGLTCNGCSCELRSEDDRQIGFCNACLGHMRHCRTPKMMVASSEVYSLYRYDSVRDIVLDAKDDNKPHLTTSMGRLLYRFYLECGLHADIVCFVPSGKKNLRKRGYDHMHYVAEEFSKQSGLPVGYGLVRIKDSSDQTEISAKERYENVRKSFVCQENYEGKTVLLLDDVITTGATLSACMAAFRKTMPAKIIGLTFGKAGD